MRTGAALAHLVLAGCCLMLAAGQGVAGHKNGAGVDQQSHASGNQNGGAGLPGKDGKPGMNGCPGGTQPAPGGKYYLPGTTEECNPA
ncbi:hypothetical protein ABRZ24_18755 [Brenneria populi]|uniref:Collagen-like protein n=1 Tax=Brenneria populi TaxID=1505588 RepID=A0ABU6JV47_9GAMM|nr:hypothetical protein [Brenneria populi Li et al. 2015]